MSVRLLTIAQVAAELGCSTRTVKRRIQDGTLPAFRSGGLVRVREADVRRFVLEHVERRSALVLPLRPTGSAVPPDVKLWD